MPASISARPRDRQSPFVLRSGTYRTIKRASALGMLLLLAGCADVRYQEAGYELLQGYLYQKCSKEPWGNCSEPPSFDAYQERMHERWN